MAHSISRQARTQADDLRDLLDKSYTAAVNVKGAGAEQARQLLANLDRIHELFPQLEAQGGDLRAERGRWQEIQGAVRRHAADLRAELAPLGGIRALRESLPDAPSRQERWWWWLDAAASQHIRKRLLVTVAVIAGIALALVGGVWAFNKFFPVDPLVSAAYGHKLNAENLVTEGKLQEAVTELEAARDATPDDPDILTSLAALYDLTDQEDKARPILQKLRADFPPSVIDSNIAQSYVAAGAVEKALTLSLQAVEEDPKNPQSYLVVGIAYEALGKTSLASQYYQQAANVASAVGDHQMEAFAKVRLAALIQKPRLPGSQPTTSVTNGG